MGEVVSVIGSSCTPAPDDCVARTPEVVVVRSAGGGVAAVNAADAGVVVETTVLVEDTEDGASGPVDVVLTVLLLLD
jgi:hypothetical protein